MVQLKDKGVLVLGGTGSVGEGIVRRFLAADARVIVPSRSQDRLITLQERLQGRDGRLTTLTGELDALSGIERLRDRIVAHHGPLNIVVASIGGWWQGTSLMETSLEDWQQLIASHLTPHFLAAKTFLPLLAERSAESSYLFINGGAAVTPIPGSGLISIMAAAQLMLKDVLVAEQGEQGVRINALAIHTPVIGRTRTEGNAGWLTADDVGAYSVHLAMTETVRGQTIVVKNRIQVSEIGHCKRI